MLSVEGCLKYEANSIYGVAGLSNEETAWGCKYLLQKYGFENVKARLLGYLRRVKKFYPRERGMLIAAKIH